MAPGAAVFLKKSVQPLFAPMKRSRSPSSSISPKAGLELRPILVIPNGLVLAAA